MSQFCCTNVNCIHVHLSLHQSAFLTWDFFKRFNYILQFVMYLQSRWHIARNEHTSNVVNTNIGTSSMFVFATLESIPSMHRRLLSMLRSLFVFTKSSANPGIMSSCHLPPGSLILSSYRTMDLGDFTHQANVTVCIVISCLYIDSIELCYQCENYLSW